MNSQSLASEFLRLSGLYPELRHALVIGNERWASMKLPRDEMRMFDDPGLKLINAYGVNSDRFARVYCLWQGKPDQERVKAAENEFHRLAQIAAGQVQLKDLTSRGGHVQLTCTVSDCVVEPQDGYVKTGIPQVQIPLINKWVYHIVIVNGVVRRPCEMHSKDTIGQCQVMLLPLDSFRASAIALAVACEELRTELLAKSEVQGVGQSANRESRPHMPDSYVSGDSRQEHLVSVAVHRLTDILPEVDRSFAHAGEAMNGIGRSERDQSRLAVFDALHWFQYLKADLELAVGYFRQLGLGPDAEILLTDAKEMDEKLNKYGEQLVLAVDLNLREDRFGEMTAEEFQLVGEIADDGMALEIEMVLLEKTIARLRKLFDKIAGDLNLKQTLVADDSHHEAAPEQTAATSSANNNKLFPLGIPSNPDIVDLAVRLNSAKGTDKSANSIAIEFTGGNANKASSLLSQIRRLRREGRICD